MTLRSCDCASARTPDIRDLGRIDYAEAWAFQRERVDLRARGEIPDTVLVCEHPPVITVGRGTRDAGSWPAYVTGPDGRVPVHIVERGGQATYHGPGQLVVYPIVRLDRARLGLDVFLRRVEEVLIRTCREAGVAACRKEGCTGVWVGSPGSGARSAGLDAGGGPRDSGPGTLLKLGSIGVAVRRWVTYHGLALNVSTDLRYFRLIRPCGLDPAVMTSLKALLGDAAPDVAAVAARLRAHWAAVFDPQG